MAQPQTSTNAPTGFCPYVPPLAGTPDENAAWIAEYRASLWQQWEEDRPAREAREEALRLNPVPPMDLPDHSRTVEQVLIDLLGQDTWDLIAPGA